MLDVSIRGAVEKDVEPCGEAIFAAFKALADRHGFPADFPSSSAAAALVVSLLASPTVRGLVAEHRGRLVGCNFIDLSPPAAGIGPIAVRPGIEASGIGRRLMRAALDRAAAAGLGDVRLNQAAYNNASLGLYTKLGFHARALVSVVQGPAPAGGKGMHRVRTLQDDDVATCGRLCRSILDFERPDELRTAIARGSAMGVAAGERLVGYTTGIGFLGHAVGVDNEALKALIRAAPSYPGPGFLLPTGNHDLLGWCLENGLRLVMQMTYMTTAPFSEPNGRWLPSIVR